MLFRPLRCLVLSPVRHHHAARAFGRHAAPHPIVGKPNSTQRSKTKHSRICNPRSFRVKPNKSRALVYMFCYGIQSPSQYLCILAHRIVKMGRGNDTVVSSIEYCSPMCSAGSPVPWSYTAWLRVMIMIMMFNFTKNVNCSALVFYSIYICILYVRYINIYYSELRNDVENRLLLCSQCYLAFIEGKSPLKSAMPKKKYNNVIVSRTMRLYSGSGGVGSANI